MFQKPLKELIWVNTTMTFIGAIFTPFYITYIQTLNGSFYFAGYSLAIFSIVTGILIFFIGRAGSSYQNKKVLIALGYALRGIAFLLIGTSTDAMQVILGLICLSSGTALSLPAFDSLYTRHVNQHDSSIQWSGLQSLAQIVIGIAALLGVILVQKIGFEGLFITLGFMALIVSVYVVQSKELV
jgi:MFS family permease